MLNKLPIMSDRKRETVSDEELQEYYRKVNEYYMGLPFDEEQALKEESFYRVMERVFYPLNFFKGTEVLHPERLCTEKGTIYVSNHIGSFDQFFLTKALGNMPLHYLVKDKVTTWPIRWNLIYKPAGSIVVNQESIKSWREAKARLVQLLLHDHSIFIFPEGTRRGPDNLGEFHAGVAQVVQESGRKVSTLAIKNSAKLLSNSRPIVCVGKTIQPSPRDGIRIVSQNIQSAVYENYAEIVAYEKTLKRR